MTEQSFLNILCSCGEKQILLYNPDSLRYEPQLNPDSWVCDTSGWHCATPGHYEAPESELYTLKQTIILTKWHEALNETIATLTFDSVISVNVTNPRLDLDFDSAFNANSGYFKISYDSIRHLNGLNLDPYLQDFLVPWIENFLYGFLSTEKEP